MGLGTCLGKIFYWLRFRTGVVQTNLSYAYPSGSETRGAPASGSDSTGANAKEIRDRISRESYHHFGNLILEVCMLLGPLRKFVQKYVDVVGVENWQKANRLGKGVIFLSSHVGNWEIMAATGGILAGIDLMLVTKRIKPAWLHEAIEKGRLACGVKATYEPRTMRDIIAHLKSGGTVGFVLDQHAGAPVGVRVPLFSVTAGTSLVVATFAKRTGVPVVPVVNYRKPDGRWVVQVFPAVEWQSYEDSHYELASNTAHYTRILEGHILEHPEQWLWVHRRFKGDSSPVREGEWNAPRARR